MEVYVIRFEDENGNYFEYRKRMTEGMEVRSAAVTEWYPSAMRNYDEVRAMFLDIGHYREVHIDDATPGFFQLSVVDQLKPVLQPPHKCTCPWDQVYREGCKCKGV